MLWSNFVWNFFSWILASCWCLQKWKWVLTDFSNNSRQIMQDPIIKPIAELDTKTLQDLLPEIPLWVKNPDYDRVGTWHSLSTTINSLELNSLDNAFSFHSVLEVTGVESLFLLTIFAYNSVLEFGGVENPILLTVIFYSILLLHLLESRIPVGTEKRKVKEMRARKMREMCGRAGHYSCVSMLLLILKKKIPDNGFYRWIGWTSFWETYGPTSIRFVSSQSWIHTVECSLESLHLSLAPPL